MCLASYALLAVAMAFGNADRFWKHDEAVYLSQALPDENLAWGPQRAIGILPLAYLVALFVDNPLLGRFVAGFVAAAVIALAFTIWTETLPVRTTVLALLVAGFAWITLHQAVAVMPNLWSAIAAVATVGCVAAYLQRSERVWLWGAGAAMAAVGLIRPADAVFLALALLVYLLVARGPRTLRALVALGIGSLAALVPWVIQSYVLFGGVVERLETLSRLSETRLRSNILDYLRLLDGPQLGPDPNPADPVLVIVVGVTLLLAVGGAVLAIRRKEQSMVLASVAGATLAVLPLFLYGFTAPRFLIPSLVLLALPVAGLLVLAWDQDVILRAVVMVFAVVFVGSQVVTLDSVTSAERRTGLAVQQIGSIAQPFEPDTECTLHAANNIGPLTLASTCRVRRLKAPPSPDTLRDGPGTQYVVLPRGRSESLGFEDWPVTPVEGSNWDLVVQPD